MGVLSNLHYSIRKKKQQRNRRYKWQAARWIYRGGEKKKVRMERKTRGKKSPPYAISLLIAMNKNCWLGHEGQD